MPRKKPPLKERELITCLKVLQTLSREHEKYQHHPRFTALLRDAQRLLTTHEKATPEVPEKDMEAAESTAVFDIGVRLAERKRCYACKKTILERHSEYTAFCVPCGTFNRKKRDQSADLYGWNAIVTGGRSKIGYATCLKLLRAGATVFATTRFPKHAAERYAKEEDFAHWKDRLHIAGLDLRSVPAIAAFVKEVESVLGTVEILINNAAQTIRRPPLYYQPLFESEMAPFQNPDALELLSPETRKRYEACVGLKLPPPTFDDSEAIESSTNHALLPWSSSPDALQMLDVPKTWQQHSAFLTSVPFLKSDWEAQSSDFPPDEHNLYNEQADLRDHTSWEMEMEEVETFELFEVHMINAMAPFLLMRDLRPLMLRSRQPRRFVVNVTSIEGQFAVTKSPTKGPRHPHTNMTKAALNMLTLSGASADASKGIYRFAVDPGWASIENALPVREHWFSLGVKPPITMEDAAARLCDPVFASLQEDEEPVFGKLWKDYIVVNW